MFATPKVWFLTGSSTGFGRSLAELLLSRGEIVVATLRNPSDLDPLVARYPTSQLLVLKYDVTKPKDIKAAFTQMQTKFGRCDVVFNNAGFGALGEIESTADDVQRSLFEVNFFGAANVNKEAVGFFREVNPKGTGGRLLVTSSMAGIFGFGGIGYYSARSVSNFLAIIGLCEALPQELSPAWNIKITIINPGAFRTKAAGESVVKMPVHPAYADDTTLHTQVIRKWMTSSPVGADVDKAVLAIYELASEENPPLHFALGKDTVERMMQKGELLKGDVRKYERWSENLEFDEV